MSSRLKAVSPLLIMIILALIAWIPRWQSPYMQTKKDWDAMRVDWTRQDYPYKVISGRSFRNETVQLDGYSYINCTFSNVTFAYDGSGPMRLESNRFEGSIKFTGSNPATNNAMSIVVSLIGGFQQQGAPVRFIPQ